MRLLGKTVNRTAIADAIAESLAVLVGLIIVAFILGIFWMAYKTLSMLLS